LGHCTAKYVTANASSGFAEHARERRVCAQFSGVERRLKKFRKSMNTFDN